MGRDVSTTGRRQFATTRWSLVLAAGTGPSAQAGPARGRFRSFLLTSMQNFLASEWRRQAAVKRGGDVTIVSIDYEDAETRYEIEPAHALTPEAIYERRWALALLERAVDDVRQRYAGRGQTELFDALKGYLGADPGGVPYQKLSQ